MVHQKANPQLKLFSLSSNPEIAEKIAEATGLPLGKVSSRQFSDGEIMINIEESVRGDDIYIIQSTSNPVNDHLWELLIMIDAANVPVLTLSTWLCLTLVMHVKTVSLLHVNQSLLN